MILEVLQSTSQGEGGIESGGTATDTGNQQAAETDNRMRTIISGSLLANRRIATLLLGILVCATPVIAGVNAEQEVLQQEDRTIYNPAYFERYSPQTAADMVAQIPGFTLAGAERFNNGDQARGLGQGDGNLLINGKRPSTKDDGPLVLLGRIPAESVKRLEILNEGSTELARQSGQIVNVVTQVSDQTTGSWQAQVHTQEKGATNPFFKGSLNGKLGNSSYTVGIDWYGNEFPQWGPETAYDADGNIFEIRDEHGPYYNRGTTANFGLAWEGENGHAVNMSLRGTYMEATFRQDSDQHGAHLPLVVNFFLSALCREMQ